jgi:tripartite ATP-independent transporter DctM subunit
MSPEMVGLIGLVVLCLLFAVGMPIGFVMALVGFAGFSYLISPSAGLALLSRDIFDTFSNNFFTVFPMFILMGSIAYVSGISGRLYEAAYKIFGSMRGGLAIATIAACAVFAAVCGSSNATAAAMGRAALPEMKKYRYDSGLACGAIAAGGTLGILIPPSSVLIIYGILTEQSIAKLYAAGIVPGICLAIFLALTIIYLCWRQPLAGPSGKPTSLIEKVRAFSGIVEAIILFLIVIGGMMLGWFSPMLAGAVGAAGALLMGLAKRKLTWKGILFGIKDTAEITSMVMLILAGAIIFGHFMDASKIPAALVEWIKGLPLPGSIIMLLIIIAYFIGGTALDSLAMVILTIPIVYPMVLALGYDPLWFGVIIVLECEMGLITPPYGLNQYVIMGLDKELTLQQAEKGIWTFSFAMLIFTMIMLMFPQLATWLPSFTSY